MSTWLNEHEIDDAVRQFSDHPILGPAARYLSDYRDLINANSDGWPYWNAGTNPAGNLSRLIADARMAEYGVGRTIYVEPTLKDVLAAITPIKSFITRYNNKHAQSTKPALVLPVILSKSRWEANKQLHRLSTGLDLAKASGMTTDTLANGEIVIYTGLKFNTFNKLEAIR